MLEIEADQSSSIHCNDCGAVILVHESGGKRVPCPMCGSIKRFIDQIITRQLTLKSIRK
ncbi:hypothetical protein LCGC14_2275290 [marine sediment metagenome]|uniref:Uncharacterized protein n=1 Tax=marine sediment metagenome TaxID=412755 RepID=A0A0F9F8A2_9ZZZZ